jgi:iron complex outermembrane receptor protein
MKDLAQTLNTDQKGAFCQNVFLFNKAPPGVTVTAQNKDQFAFYTTNPNDCNITRRISSKKPTWLIEGDWRPNNDVMVYAKWARGYRMGSITSNSIGFETVGPERLDLYEVGAKTSFRGAVSGYFNVAAFYNDFHDQQITINPVLNPIFQGVLTNSSPNINAGHSRIWGAEIDASATFFDSLKIDVGYTYLNTKVKQITLPAIPVSGGIPLYTLLNSTAAEGDPLALSPKNTVVVTGTYTLPLDESAGRLSVAATFTHIDANRAESPLASPLYLIKAENQLNLNLDWHAVLSSPFDLSVFVTNVTNEGRILFPGSGFQTIGSDGGPVNPPRRWGVRLKYRFGE